MNFDLLIQIFEAIPDLVLVKGPESRLLWANRAFRDYYGMSNEELRGIIDAPFNLPDYTQKYVQDDAYVFNTGKILDIPEEPVTRHDGHVRVFHTIKAPLFDTNGNVKMTVGISRDIHDRKLQEEQIAEQQLRLTHASKMSSLGEMAGGIAHEINNPLAIIMGFSELLEDSANQGTLNPPELTRISGKISSTVKRISRIVKALRTFARNADVDPLQSKAVVEIITDTLDFCSQRIEQNGIDMRVDPIPESLQGWCRSVQISQVLLNLLNNASDAVSQSPEKWIRIRAEEADSWVEIQVIDSGAGVPPELLEKIFEPFFTTKEVGQGTGLGLSVSRGIMNRHGGELAYRPFEGHSCFVIRMSKAPESGTGS